MTDTVTRPPPDAPDVRSRRRGRRRRWWLWLVTFFLLVVVAGVWAAVLALDAYSARDALLTARAAVADAETAVADGDLAGARAAVDVARDASARARQRTSAPWWDAAAALPVLGHTPRVAQAMVEVADAAAGVAAAAVAQGEALVGPEGGVPLEIRDGRVALEPLRAAGAALGGVSVAELEAARTRLADLSGAGLPDLVAGARLQALDVADRVLQTVGRGRTALDVLPSFLGGDGPRRYLLGIQTPAELRGTGGLLESLAILTADDGALTLGPAVDVGTGADPDAVQLTSQRDLRGEAVPAPPEFEERYGGVGATRRFDRVNLDPDLPTVAPVALDLYEQVSGDRLDGLVVLDPVALEHIMRAVGPVEVPPTVRDAAGSLPARIPPGEIAEWALDRLYEVYGDGRGEQRQAFKEALTSSVFARLLAGGYDEVRAARRLADAAGRRHLQLWTRDPDEQAAFEGLGVGGRFGPGAPTHDFVAVTAVNAIGSKQDALLGHRVGGTLELGAPDDGAGDDATDRLRRELTLRTEVVNPLPSEGRDLYVIGNCIQNPPEGSGCFDGPPGYNRTWFTTWLPAPTAPVGGRSSDGPLEGAAVDRIRGLTAVDQTMETPPQSENWFEFDYRGQAPVRRDGDDFVYTLEWWQQAKAIPTHLDLAVRAPPGWDVVTATSTGGGSGEAMGALPEGPRLEADVTGREVRWHGAVTRDATLEVRLRPPRRSAWDRFRDWLGQPLF